MDQYYHDYKEYSMTQAHPTNVYYPTPINECSQKDKEQLPTHLLQLSQRVENASPTRDSSISIATNSNIPKFGKVIPNRVFVGGIDFKTKEEDLQKYFSSFGSVTHAKVVRDRAEVSKGFGFVTFESSDEADKVREKEDCLYLNGKKLNIGPAIEKHQTNFPKDIHIPGPPGSWIIHPGGYASYTHQNGITYFPPALPMLSTAQQQTRPYIGPMVAYSGALASYQTVPAQYGSYAYPAPYNGQACNLPYATPIGTVIGGTCGQVISPAAAPVGTEQLNVLPMTQPHPGPGYVVQRSMPQNQPTLAVNTKAHVVSPSVQRESAAYVSQQVEPIRMMVPPTSPYMHQPPMQPYLHASTAVYAQPVPLKYAHAQYVGVPEAVVPIAGRYDIDMPGPQNAPLETQPVVTSQNEILTPPLTPEQHSKL